MSSFTATIDTFHFLVDRLEITPESKELQKKFEQYDKEHPDEYHLQEMEEFAEQEKDEGSETITVNTYNGENSLSQTLQYTTFQKDGKNFVLLQIHGGADVRGGYTAPHIFELDDKYRLMNNNYITASVPGSPDKYWDTDDGGYHWYFDGRSSSDHEWLSNPDVPEKDGSLPKTWEITEEGIFYKPTGEPINFGDGPQWWESNPKIVAKWAPTSDERQGMLKRKRLKA